MNDGAPPAIPITLEPRLIQPPLNLRQSSAFSHGDTYIFDITANSNNLIVSASTNEIKLYNPATLAIKNVLKFHTEPITQVKVHGEHLLMSSSKDGRVAVWDLRTEAGPVQVFTSKKPQSERFMPRGIFGSSRFLTSKSLLLDIAPAKDPLLAFDINSSENVIAAGTELIEYDANIHFFDARSHNATVIKTYSESHSDDITNVKFHPTNPARLMTASVDGLICQFDLQDMDEDEGLLVVANTGSSVNRVGYFGPNSEYIYCLSHMETLSLWSAEDAEAIHQFGDIRGVTNPSLGLTLDYGIDCQYEPETGRLYLLSGSNE